MEQRIATNTEHADAPTDERPVVIVGFGTAGVNALIALRNEGYNGRVVAFSNAGDLPYSPILTSYYAGGQKTREQCFPWSKDEIEQLDAEIRDNCPVEGIDVVAHEVHTAEGCQPYAKCIISTGSTPLRDGFPQDSAYDPLVLRTLDDAEKLKAALDDPACDTVLVSGTSMVALKSLEACLDRGKRTVLVGRSAHILKSCALPDVATRFEEELAGKGVDLQLGNPIRTVQPVEDERGARAQRVRVELEDGTVVLCDEIVLAHGMKPNLDFVSEGTLEMDRGLLVNEFMRTSDPDVYAVGDVAQALDLSTGDKRIVGIWKNAALQGYCAGAAIAAEQAGHDPSPSAAFPGSVPANTIAVSGALFISGGTVALSDERHVEMRENDGVLAASVFEGEKLVGFNVFSPTDDEGGTAYDVGAMLMLRLEESCRR